MQRNYFTIRLLGSSETGRNTQPYIQWSLPLYIMLLDVEAYQGVSFQFCSNVEPDGW